MIGLHCGNAQNASFMAEASSATSIWSTTLDDKHKIADLATAE
jgi:hypothetical protein